MRRMLASHCRNILPHARVVVLLPAIVRRHYVNASLTVGLGILSVGIPAIYLSYEHGIYFWDFAHYHDLAIHNTRQYQQNSITTFSDLISGVRHIRGSTGREYSDYYTVPIAPIMAILGESRLVYVISIALLYQLPYALTLGAIAREISLRQHRLVFWSTVFLTLLTPFAWMPTLRGYPDVAASFLMSLGILFYVQDRKVGNWRKILLVGLMLGLAVLVRRHFVYGVMVLFASAACYELLMFMAKSRHDRAGSWRGLRAATVRLVWMQVATFVSIMIFGKPFVDRLLQTDFVNLYASYEWPIDGSTRFYAYYYGALPLVLAGAGFVAGIAQGTVSGKPSLYLALCTVFSLAVWIVHVRQLGLQYTLHITTGIIVGLSVFAVTIYTRARGAARLAVLASVLAFLVANIVTSSAPSVLAADAKTIAATGSSGWWWLFAGNNPPLQRTDRQELFALLSYLEALNPGASSVFVASYSETLNADLVRHSLQKSAADSSAMSAIKTPTGPRVVVERDVGSVDSQTGYPLGQLLRSAYVVVATPFQHELRVEEQRVARSVVDCFALGCPAAHDFRRLPPEFHLQGGVVVTVFERVRESSLETAIRTLGYMEAAVGRLPGGQGSWIGPLATGEHRLLASMGGDRPYGQTAFIYLGKLADVAELSAMVPQWDVQCTGVSMWLLAVDRNGNQLASSTLERYPSDAAGFALSVGTRGAAYLVLSMAGGYGAAGDACHAWIDGVRVAVI